MLKLTLSLGGAAAAILLATLAAAPAQAQPTKGLYSGGATFPERVYRDIMNCYGDHSGTDTETGLSSHVCSTGDLGFLGPYRPDVQVLYSGVGSGNGIRGIRTHDAGPTGFTSGGRIPDSVPVPSTSDFGPHYGTATGAAWAATKSTANPFPTVSFTGTDDPIPVADVLTYNTNSAAGNWGPLKQAPAFVGAVGVSYKAASGVGITWTEKGKKPAGGILPYSLVSLTTETWCGIFNGDITDWNSTEIKDDNGGVYITTGTAVAGPAAPITVVYRSDGSGTTFIFVNAMINQCATTAHPIPLAWQDEGANTAGLSHNNWFVNTAALLPAHFVGKPGNLGVADHVAATAGAVGYNSTDFMQPYYPTGPKAMNLQTWASKLAATSPVYKQPNAKTAAAIMAATVPPVRTAGSCPVAATYAFGTSPDGICSNNPVNWGVAVPLPTSPAAFPIGGFTFLEIYTCYDPAGATNSDALFGKTAGSLGFLTWYFGSPAQNASKVKNSLAANGFGPVPGKWLSAVKKHLFTDKLTKLANPGQANTGCSALPATGGA